jgi:hypothetical protein
MYNKDKKRQREVNTMMYEDRLNKVTPHALAMRLHKVVRCYEEYTRRMNTVSKEDTVARYFAMLNQYEEEAMLIMDYAMVMGCSENRKACMEGYIVRMEAAKTNFYETNIEKVEMFGII